MGRRKREGWLWVGLVIFQPVVILALHYWQFSMATVLYDWFVRLLLVGIAVWVRRSSLPLFRYGPLRALLILLCPLVLVALALSASAEIAETQLGLKVLDALINGYIVALSLEAIFSAMGWAAFLGKGGGGWPTRLAERARFLRRAVQVLQKAVFSLTLLLLLALFALSRNFFFDWIIYSRICMVIVGAAFLVPLLIINHGVRKKTESELALVETEMEHAANRAMTWRADEEGIFNPGYFRFWLDYRQALLNSLQTPLSWETWALLVLLQLTLLLEPHLFGVLAI